MGEGGIVYLVISNFTLKVYGYTQTAPKPLTMGFKDY